MRSSLSTEKRSHKLSGEHLLEHSGSEPPYSLHSFKRHKISASPQFHTNIGEIAAEPHGTCNAGVTDVETAFENLKGRPSNLPVKVAPIELKSVAVKPPVLQCKASSMNVKMELLRVPEKVELHNLGNYNFVPKHIDVLCCSDTSSTPCVLPRKYPLPKIRKGVTIFREFPRGCGKRNLDLFNKFDVKVSEEKQMMFEAEKEQFRGESCNVGSGFARKAEGKILMDIADKVTAESDMATQADKAELFENVFDSECKFNQESSIDTIMIASSPASNSLQADSSSKMTSNNDGVKSWKERNGNDPNEYSRCKLADVSNSVMHSVNIEYDGSGFARKAEGKILMDINDKVTAESDMATQADKAELFENVFDSECKFNQESSIDTIMIASSPASNSLQADSSSKMTSNNDGVKSWKERNGNDPNEYSRHKLADVSNSVVMHSVNNEYDGIEFARKAEGKILMDINDKVTAESDMATQADKAELFENVFYSECKFNQESSIDTITIASSPASNSLQADSSSKMTSNNDGVTSWTERNGNDPGEYSRHKLADVSNSVVMHSVNNEYVDMAHSGGCKSVGQREVKSSDFAAVTGATDGCSDKANELMGHKGSYYMLLKQNGTKSNDGESATRMGVTTLDYEAATGATGGCSDIVYELMGHEGSYYLLLKSDDTIFNDGTTAAEESQEVVKTSDRAAAIVATDGCWDNKYELMGQKGSYYLLLKLDDTNIHVPYMEADVYDVEAGIHTMEAVSGWKDNVTHLGKPSINLAVNVNQEALCRSKVREVLNLFQKTLNERLEKQVTRKSKAKAKTVSSHIYEEVAMLLKQQKEWIYMNERVVGAIPGVEVGDQFQYRAELVIVGVHVQFVADIDYMEKDSLKIATSIVSIHCYSDDEELTDVTYCCEGDNETMAHQDSKDQKLVHGMLALKNSMAEESPVRIIRGHQSSEGKSTTYTYDGLYIVSKCWQETGQNGKLVYMFQLNKMPGQPKLKVNKLGKHRKSKARFYRTLIDDISYGKEKIAIPVVNDVDNDKPPIFNYITKMVYPQIRKSANARGCRCISGCSDDVQCSCVVKNGGMVPFNEDGALVKAKPIVHECGPSCKCPPSCMNRVSQHGLKVQLEVFKTEMRGWGIRSRNFISSGSFICEYVGELLDDKQAEERIGFDEYLFDIGDEDTFAIDAAKIANVGRFVNHSCSPNLFAQDVLFDHDDKMMPHVMLFAARNIPPLQELTYDYNYKVGHISDSNGNVKEKTCHCGARKCTGRMY